MPEYRLWAPSVLGPPATTEDVALNLATEFRTGATPLWLAGISYWKPDAAMDGAITVHARTIDAPGSGTLVPGTQLLSPVGDPGGWVDVLYPTPVALAPNTAYQAVTLFPSGYSATANYWTSGLGAAGIVNGPLSAPSAADSTGGGRQGSLGFDSIPAYPSMGSGSGANYWVQPIVTDEDPAGPIDRSGAIRIGLSLATSTTGLKDVAGSVVSGLALDTGTSAAKDAAGQVVSALAVATAVAGGKSASGAVASPLSLATTVTGSGEVSDAPRVSDVLCSAWATHLDVSARQRDRLGDATDEEVDDALLRASELLWALSGRVWQGAGCQETAVLTSRRPRPGRDTWPYHDTWGACGCWAPPGNALPLSSALRLAGPHDAPQPVAVRLPNSRITKVISVTVAGAPFAAWEWSPTGWLRRTDGRAWGTCHDDTEVLYAYGQPPPRAGVAAAVALGIELALSAVGSRDCALPQRTVSVTRQGISMEMLDPMEFLSDGLTGLYEVDLWLRTVNPQARPERARVWSPDLPATSRRFS